MTPIELVQSRIEGLIRSGDSGRQWVGCCPAHDDNRQSLAVAVADNGNVLVRCYAGCETKDIVAAIGLKLRDLFPIPEDGRGVSLGRLAFHKALDVGWLKACGLRQPRGESVVEIPYLDEAGKELFVRRREAVKAKDGTNQPAKVSLRPYGLWKLDEFRQAGKDTLILVEGESDCWRLWFHGYAALGLPGASTAKTLTAENVAGFAAVLIWSEPDGGGKSFLDDLTKRLDAVGYQGRVLCHRAARDAKDPGDIGAHLRNEFPAAMDAILAAATPVSADGAGAANGAGPGGPARVPPTVALAGWSASPFPWGRHEFTDLGNAGRLHHAFGEDLLYVPPWDRWYHWDGVRWEHDQTMAVQRLAARTTHGIWWESRQAPSRTAAMKAEQWWLASQSSARLAACVTLAKPAAAAAYGSLDGHPDLFNAANCTIDLTTGEAREPRRDDRLTARSPVRYDPAAKCPLWERTLDQIFAVDPDDPAKGPDAELVEFMQRLLGCCLTGQTPHMLPILYGLGANGKSLIVNVMGRVLGLDYAMTAPSNLLMVGATERHPTEIADLHGKRAVFCVESNDGAHLNAGLVKQLTGGDRIRARRMREDHWQFTPTHKLILCTNHKPTIGGDDPAVWRRLLLIPFRCVFWNPDKGETGPEHRRQDKGLERKLADEMEGILAWLVRGAVLFHESGMPQPKAVADGTSQYREQEDRVGLFLEERTTRCAASRVTKEALHRAFTEWCAANNYGEVGAKRFGEAMDRKGYAEHRTARARFWVGLDLDNTNEHMREIDGL